uniref:Uncharacterized protein n=1 Tax=Panagrolaimus superbus TaxID=310955 RepID=A0A914YIC6_9BILA
MFHTGAGVLHFHGWEGVCSTALADQQRITLGVIAGVFCLGGNTNQAAIGIDTLARRNPLGDNRAAGIATHMNHLGAGIGLLAVVAQGDRVELALGIIAAQHHAGVFPGDGRASFNLRPGDVRTCATAFATLGDEVVNTAYAVFIAGVPVLHGGVLDLGVVQGDQFHDRCVQLVSSRIGAVQPSR